MQQHYENQPLVWHEVPSNRLSRQVVTYRARPQRDWEVASLSDRLPKLFIALAAVLVLITAFCVLSDNGSDANAAGIGESATSSTPRAQWIKGKMPYLYQTDTEWGASPYAGATVAESGCGPTCMSMAYVYLTGKKDRDPVQMAAFSEEKGFVEGGLTTWTFITEGSRMLGLRAQELSADESLIRSQLAAGHPIIASVRAGDFTTSGHFIVLESEDAFGRILIRDPNSPERSGQAWELSRILSQTRNLWAISV